MGAVELHRHSSTVFLACYYRYYRFFPNGQVGASLPAWDVGSRLVQGGASFEFAWAAGFYYKLFCTQQARCNPTSLLCVYITCCLALSSYAHCLKHIAWTHHHCRCPSRTNHSSFYWSSRPQPQQLLYRTSPHVLKLVARSLARTPAALQAAARNPEAHGRGGAADDAQHVYIGRYCVASGKVCTVIVYPNSRGTEVRARLTLRSTSSGACNRMDVDSLCTYDWETGTSSPFPTDPRGDEEVGHGTGADRQEHRRGLAPFVFVPWEQVLTSPLNLPSSKMDVFLPG